MKLVSRALAVAVVCAGSAIGLASPAWAEELLGPYTLFSDQSQRAVNGVLTPYPNSSSVWTFTPCGPGCTNIQSQAGWASYAYLVNGRWEFTRETIWQCPDGRNLPLTVGYSIDPVTLTGTSTGTVPVGCEGFPLFADGVTVSLTKL